MTEERIDDADDTGEVSSASRRRRLAIATVVVVVLVAGGAFALTRSGGDPAVGTSVSGITLRGFDGEGTVELASYAGRPLVINYWASWCAFCIEEMPDFQAVFGSLGGRVAFLGVDLQDDPELAAQLVRQTGVRYDLAADPDGASFLELGGLGMPTTLFVDERGRIVERSTGPLTADALRDRIERHFGV